MQAGCSPQGWVSKWFSAAVAVYAVHVDDPVVGPSTAVEDNISRALSVQGFPMDTPETEQSSELRAMAPSECQHSWALHTHRPDSHAVNTALGG